MRSQNIRRGDCFGARNLQVIEINLGFLAARNRARRGEQFGILIDHQNRKQFRERTHLFKGVDRLQRNVDVHSVAAGCFRITRQSDRVERFLYQLRRFDDLAVRAAFGRDRDR